MPERVIFDPKSLEYPLGRELYNTFQNHNIEIIKTSIRNASRYIPGDTPQSQYVHSKRTVVVTIMREKELDVCKPSADYEFSLVGNCPGNCEYCYLQTTQGRKPFIRIFVNLDDIFNLIKKYIKKNDDKITIFEAASLGDPLALEHLTGSLAKTIEFFGTLKNGRLRVVTKFSNVDSLLELKHNNHTHFRLSINSEYIVKNFEHTTASIDERLEASVKLAKAGYPLGFVVAPIMIYENWKEEYSELFAQVRNKLGPEISSNEITFELIQHRFTSAAKKLIVERFPKTRVDLKEENRVLKWGKYGRYKYIYPKEMAIEIKEYISSIIKENFPNPVIEYFT